MRTEEEIRKEIANIQSRIDRCCGKCISCGIGKVRIHELRWVLGKMSGKTQKTEKMSEKLYKFLNGNESENGDHTWEIGKWYEVEAELKMCENGFHASKYVQDALSYVQGDTLAVVEVDGECVSRDDKQCWQKMRVVETHDWTPIHSLKLAIYSAKIANDGYDEYGCVEIAEVILKKLQSGEDVPNELLSAAWAAKSAGWASVGWAAGWAAVAAGWAAEAARAAMWTTESAVYAAVSAESAAMAVGRVDESAEIKQKIHEYCLTLAEVE